MLAELSKCPQCGYKIPTDALELHMRVKCANAPDSPERSAYKAELERTIRGKPQEQPSPQKKSSPKEPSWKSVLAALCSGGYLLLYIMPALQDRFETANEQNEPDQNQEVQEISYRCMKHGMLAGERSWQCDGIDIVVIVMDIGDILLIGYCMKSFVELPKTEQETCLMLQKGLAQELTSTWK